MFQNNKRRGVKALAAGLALSLVLSVFSGCGQKSNAGDEKAVATYKNGEVTQREFDTFLGVTKMMDYSGQTAQMLESPEMKDYLLEQLLQQQAMLEILASDISAEGKKEGDAKVKEFNDQVTKMEKAQKEDFEKKMKEYKIDKGDLEDYVRNTVGIMSDMERKVTDAQIKDEYDKQLKTDPHFFDIVTVRHILIGTKDPSDPEGKKELRSKEAALKLAKEVKAKLDAGGNFDELAKQYSEDPGSKDNGGKYENQNVGTSSFVPPFKKAMAEQEVNKISDPVETDFGYHIIRVDSRKTETVEDKKQEMKQMLAQRSLQDFMEKEFPKYEFKSNLPKPSPAASAGPEGSASPSAPAGGEPTASPAEQSPAPSPSA